MNAPSTTMLPQHQNRAELEAMVLGDRLGPVGDEGEELTESTVRDRYTVGSRPFYWRLLKLNYERYAEEEKQGLHGKKQQK